MLTTFSMTASSVGIKRSASVAADGENPPIVTQVELTGSYTFGNNGALIIHAVPGDATSKILLGVEDYRHPHGFSVFFGKLLSHRVCIRNPDFATKLVEFLGDDRYRVEFSIDPNVSPGDYDLCGFGVSDQFNNDGLSARLIRRPYFEPLLKQRSTRDNRTGLVSKLAYTQATLRPFW